MKIEPVNAAKIEALTEVASALPQTVPECHFSVNLPRFGGKPQRRTVYIASQNTYTPERYTRALNAAIDMRRAAEEQYQLDATAAKRRSAAKL